MSEVKQKHYGDLRDVYARIAALQASHDELLKRIEFFMPTIVAAHTRDCKTPNMLTALEDAIKTAETLSSKSKGGGDEQDFLRSH